MARKARIGICGSYGGQNLGDEAILESMLGELERQGSLADVCVIGRTSSDTPGLGRIPCIPPTHTLGEAAVEETLGELDLLILGGGGILYDEAAEDYLWTVERALESGVPVMLCAVGAGPLEEAAVRRHVREVLEQVALISVRDLRSKLLLEDLEVRRELRVIPDPAFLLEPSHFPDDALIREGIRPGTPLIGVSVRERGPAAPDLDPELYHQHLALAVEALCARIDAEVVFIPMERDDLLEARDVARRLRFDRKVHLLAGRYPPRQIRGLVSRLDFAVGMRLHFLLFAASAGVPAFGFAYGSKVSELLRELGLPGVAAQSTGPRRLHALVDRAWTERDYLRRRTLARLAGVRERAKEGAALALGLLERSPDHERREAEHA